MSPVQRHTTPLQEATLAGAVACAVFLATRTRDVGMDDCLFAMAVDSALLGKGVWWGFVHPHHPLLNPIVAVVVWIGRLVSPDWLTLDAGAAVSACFGGLAVGSLVWVLRRSGSGTGQALLGGLVLMALAGFWTFATRLEVYTMVAAAIVLWLWKIARPTPSSVGVGLSLAAVILSHLAAGVLVLPSIWRFRSRPADVGKVLAFGLGLPALVLYVVLAALHDAWSPASWLRVVAPGATVEKYVQPGGWRVLGSLFRSVWVTDWYRQVPIFEPAAVTGFHWLGTAGVVVGAALLLLGVVTTLRRDRPLGWMALGGCLCFLPIWLLWDRGNVEHAIAVSPLLVLLVVAGAERLGSRVGVSALALLAAALALVNGLGSAVPRSRAENSWSWVLASFVRESIPQDAVILTAGTSPRFRVAVPYLSDRRFVDLALLRSRLDDGQSAVVALDAWYRRATAETEIWAHPDVFSDEGRAFVASLEVPVETWDAVVATLKRRDSVRCEADGAVIPSPFVLTRVEVVPAQGVVHRR